MQQNRKKISYYFDLMMGKAITYVIGDYQIFEKRFRQIFQEPGNSTIKVRGVGNSWAGWAIVVSI